MHDGYHEVDRPNGGRFEGEIRDGMPNGPGMMLWPDGTIYKGELRDAKFHGLGIKYLPEGHRSGVERLEGEFRDDQFQTGIQWTLGDPIYFENGTYVMSIPSLKMDEAERQKRLEKAKEKAKLANNSLLK